MRLFTSALYAALHTIVFVAGLLWLTGAACARDDGQWSGSPAATREWFNSLRQPDTGGSCCGEADAVEADKWLVHPDGSVTATVTDGRGFAPDGMVVVVPPGKVLRNESNPTGHAILFLSRGMNAYCFVIGSGI